MAELDYALIFEALPSPFMILDSDLRYVAANAAYRATTGRTMDELRGRHVVEEFPNPGESGRKLAQSFDHVLATGEVDTLPYLAYPIAGADGSYSNRYWTAVHLPLRGRDGSVEFILQNTVDVTEFAMMREAAPLPSHALSAATRLIERTREAEAASADFRRLFQQAPAFFAVLSGSRHVFTFASDSYLRLIGGRDPIGLSLADALPELEGQGFIELLDRVYREGYVHQAESARLMLIREAGSEPEETFLDFSYHPIRNAEGQISGIFVQGMDRTESVRAVQRQRLLIDELNHRVKNTLATVQSIASQTLRTTSDPVAARKAFEARIVALSRAHSMLSDRQWNDTELGLLVGQELEAYDHDNIEFGGPLVAINVKATVALALVLHELASNAVRHGSLSVPAGTLVVHWHCDEADNLVVDWAERSGPAVTEPERKGFGSRVLKTVVTGELGGTLDTQFGEDGFFARLTIPPSAYRAQGSQLV